jgi:transcription initiation factor TFIIIB Brf1 subunit/transcription initiation factor TFIIB
MKCPYCQSNRIVTDHKEGYFRCLNCGNRFTKQDIIQEQKNKREKEKLLWKR